MRDSALLHPRRAFLFFTLASSLLLQGALAAPTNATTSEKQEQAQEPSLVQSSAVSLIRTRQLAEATSSSPTFSKPTVSSSEDADIATSVPTSSTRDSDASPIESTQDAPKTDIASSSRSSTSSRQDVTSSPSSSSSYSPSSTSSSAVDPTTSSEETSSETLSSSSSSSSEPTSSSISSSTSSSTLPSSSSSSEDTSAPASSSAASSSSSTSVSSIPSSSSSSSSSTPSPVSSTLASSSPASASTSVAAATSTSSSSASTSTSNAAATSSSGVFPSAKAGKAMAACSCGYRLSKFNGLYLRKRYSIDFRKYSTVSQLTEAGMFIANGYQIGNTAPDGTFVYASNSNIKLASDGAYMVVPGGQAAGGKVTGAQMMFNNDGKGMTRMWAEAHIQVDATPGTCQAFWTYTVDQSKTSDEQDMEVIAASLMEPSEVHAAGLQLTNHAPDGAKDHRTVPFPTDPSVGFHKYTIAWDRDSVSYSFDDELLDGPTLEVSQNPSNLVFNNWGSGDIGFMGAPLPATDVTMRIKAVTVYYETDFDSSLPSGCTQSQVCVV